jgi:hypothetical protein
VTVPTLLAFDTAVSDYSAVPLNAQAVLPYMDKRYRNIDAAKARFPHLFAVGRYATITAARGDADIIDWEPGNLDPPPGAWYDQQHALGRWRPGFYEDLSDGRLTVLPALEKRLGLLGPPGPTRPVRILTAHPTGKKHICGPFTCGLFPIDADGTQYWWTSLQGRWPGASGDVDVSVVRADFFPTFNPPPTPEDTMAIAVAADADGLLEVFVELSTGEVKHIKQDTSTPLQWWQNKDGTPNWLSLGNPGA